MAHKCEKCGEEFDTERGLHIHQGRKHEEETDNEEKDTTSGNPSGQGAITLGIRQVGAVTFAFGLLLGFILGGMAGGLNPAALSGDTDNTNANNGDSNTGDSGPEGPSTVDISEIEKEGEPILGAEDAPVTLVIYEDFQCPFCKRFEENTISQVTSEYVESGQVKIVWKDFPLEQIHPWATTAAETMECVYRQDNQAFWNVKDTIFQNQNKINQNNVENTIIGWASDEGISESAIRSCLENGNPGEEVQADLQEGQNFDTVISTPQGNRPFVSGTPGTVIYGEGDSEGEPVVGAQPFSVVDEIIQNKLES